MATENSEIPMSSTEAPPLSPGSRPRPVSHARDFGRGFFVKLVLVGLVDELGVYLAMTAFAQGASEGCLASHIAGAPKSSLTSAGMTSGKRSTNARGAPSGST